jgi:hypothetical protein
MSLTHLRCDILLSLKFSKGSNNLCVRGVNDNYFMLDGKLGMLTEFLDRLRSLLVEFMAADPEVPGSISGATRFFWVAVGLERDPLSLVRINDELLERKSSGSSPENWD